MAEKSGHEFPVEQNLGQENPVEISGPEIIRYRLVRSLIWDALHLFLVLLAAVWLGWQGQDLVLLMLLCITVVTTKNYFRWRQLNE